MNTWTRKLACILAASFLLSEVSIARAVSGGEGSRSWKFRVMLDDTPIGYHEVKINRVDNRKIVHTQANFDVRILFIPVYSYEHETRELWENNCVVDIDSKTDDNGEAYFISTLDSEEQLALETQDGETALDGCVRTFAYWDVNLLDSDRLLNTQTGEYEPVSVTDMGADLLSVDDQQIEARRFRLEARDAIVDLWYTKDMHWLALESETESGAVLRYLPDNLSELALSARS